MGAASVNGQLYAVAPYDSIDGGDGNIHAATYDPSTDSWTMKPGFAPGSNCCGFFALAEATDGKLYLITAVPFQPLLTFRYDPSTDTWTTRASGPAGTSYFGWVAGSDGKLYAIGGNTSTNQPVTSLEVYDPSQDQWSSGPAMPLAVTSPTVVASSAGKLYVFSDGEEQIYDLASQSWTAMQVEALVTTGMGAAPASDGKLYLAGGPGCPCNGIPSSAVWTLDPGTNAWQMQTNLLWGRYQPAVAAVGSSLYVLGGWDGEGWDLAVEEAAIPPATSSGRSNRR
jgi:N-acetylneuraminic acid mutarotase